MASLIRTGKDKQDVRIQFSLGGRRKTLRPGRGLADDELDEIKKHVEAIVEAEELGEPVARKTAIWRSTGCGHKLRRKLVKLGLAQPIPPTAEELAARAERKRPPTVEEFINRYLGERQPGLGGKTGWKWRTMNGAEQDRDSLLTYLGERGKTALDSVTPGDADDFLVWLRREGRRGGKGAAGPCAEATIGRRLRRCSQFFRAAVRNKLLAENPFDGIKAPSQENEERFFFVSREATTRMIDAAPDWQWRLIIALARYGGLRTPSETLALKWEHVDFDRGRIRVPSPKTEKYKGKASREIPLFPELRPYLDDARQMVELGTEHVITRYRDASANLRTQLLRIMKRAGLDPWERCFHNMRASRQNELAAEFPIHVVCRWIGNSTLIANKHYLSGTDDYFEAAVKSAPQSAADGADPETTGADIPLEMSAPVQPSSLQTRKGYPQGEYSGPQFARKNKALSARADKAQHEARTASGVAAIAEAILGTSEKLSKAECRDLAGRIAAGVGAA